MAGKVVNSSFVLLNIFGVSRQESASKTATSHMCAESNERLKIVTQLYVRWWNRPTDVVLQGRASTQAQRSRIPLKMNTS